jgi:hypothetical protein
LMTDHSTTDRLVSDHLTTNHLATTPNVSPHPMSYQTRPSLLETYVTGFEPTTIRPAAAQLTAQQTRQLSMLKRQSAFNSDDSEFGINESYV